MIPAQGAPYVFDMSNPDFWVPVYVPLVHCKARKEVLYGSRDSLKSGHVVRRIVARMLAKKCKGMLVRKFFNSIKGSQYDEIEKFVIENELTDHFIFRSSPLEIICKTTGARAIARGMDQSGKSKSIPGIDWVWFEEADELTLEDYTQTTLTMRGKDLKEWITFNSTYPDHWLIARFFPGTTDKDGKFTVDLSFERPDGMFTWVTSTDPSAVIFHTCYLHNPYVDEVRRREFEFMRDHMPPENYRVKGLGLIGRRNIGSLWAPNWDRTKHMIPQQVHPGLPHHLTFDQNSLPYATMIAIQIVPNGVRRKVSVFREYCMKPPKNSTESACNAWIWDWGETEARAYWYGDPTGRSEMAKKEVKEARHHYEVVDRTLAPWAMPGANRVGKKAPSIVGRQFFFQTMLAGGTIIDFEVDQSCTNVIGDIEHLVEDENGGYVKRRITDKETGQSWEERGHCFTGDTMITTDRGPKRIDLIEHGDRVLTRFGFRTVIHRFDNGIREVVDVDLAGRRVRCTADHKFFTVNRGFVPLRYLQAGDELLISDTWKASSTTAANSPGTQRASGAVMPSISRGAHRRAASGRSTCTGICGRRKGVRSRTGIMCTTSTMIPGTTSWRTSSCYQTANTSACTPKSYGRSLATERGPLQICVQQATRPLRGTDRGKDVGFTVSQHGRTRQPHDRSHADTVARSIWPSRSNGAEHVATSAGAGSGIKGLAANNGYACDAASRFQSIALSQHDIAQVHAALAHAVEEHVYDLMVNEHHEYFANGILVHNCMDAIINFLYQAFPELYRHVAKERG